MASGEVATVASAEVASCRGFVVTTSGRISGVTEPGEVTYRSRQGSGSPRRRAEVRSRAARPVRGVSRRPREDTAATRVRSGGADTG